MGQPNGSYIDVLLAALNEMARGLVASLPRVGVGILLFIAVWLFARIARVAVVQALRRGKAGVAVEQLLGQATYLGLVVCGILAGLAIAGVFCFLLSQRGAESMVGPIYDTATLLFGFSLFWGGLFFAQYLTIWYGNLPEEVGFFTRRFARPEGVPLFTATIATLFAIPFFLLLIRRARTNVSVLFILVNLTFVGLLLHTWFHLFPHVQPRAGLLFFQLLAVVILVGATVRASLDRVTG